MQVLATYTDKKMPHEIDERICCAPLRADPPQRFFFYGGLSVGVQHPAVGVFVISGEGITNGYQVLVSMA